MWTVGLLLFRCISSPGLAYPLLPCSSRTLQVVSLMNNVEVMDTHIVNTIPPLRTSRTNLGNAPDQKVRTPSSLKIRAAQTKLFLYSRLASIDCILIYISHEAASLDGEDTHTSSLSCLMAS